MNASRNNKACLGKDGIVSYIYGEMPPSERPLFEDHLAGCESCTDKFAGISLARYSAFEYKRVEFEPLVTPHIAIPFAETRLERNPIAALLSGWRIGFAGAALSLIAAAGYLLFIDRAASMDAVAVDLPRSLTPASVANLSEPVDEPELPVEKIKVAESPRRLRPVAVSRPVANRRAVSSRREQPGTYAVSKPAIRTDTRPVLSNYDETDDDSLRLSDLFDSEFGIN
jgi:hypothetical protein